MTRRMIQNKIFLVVLLFHLHLNLFYYYYYSFLPYQRVTKFHKVFSDLVLHCHQVFSFDWFHLEFRRYKKTWKSKWPKLLWINSNLSDYFVVEYVFVDGDGGDVVDVVVEEELKVVINNVNSILKMSVLLLMKDDYLFVLVDNLIHHPMHHYSIHHHVDHHHHRSFFSNRK